MSEALMTYGKSKIQRVPVPSREQIRENIRAAMAAKKLFDPATTLFDRLADIAEEVTFETFYATITPDLARFILDNHNERNRKLIELAIRRYTRFMAEGRWVTDTEPIDFDNKGNLLDGQNRLAAVTRVGLPVRMLVRWGVDPNVKTSKDTGIARTPGHVLQLSGFSDTNNLAATARLVYHYENSRLAKFSAAEHQMGKAEMVAFVSENPGIELAVTRTRKTQWATPALLSRSEKAFLYYFMDKAAPGMAERFFDHLYETGSAVGKALHPTVRALYKRLNENMTNKAKLPHIERLALCVKAWQLFKSGRTSITLRWRTAEPNPEPFPEF